MTTAIDVVCPRCNMADFVYFRCTTCKYFAIHQPDTPDLVPRRLYNVMSPDPLYPRQESWQEAIPDTTSQTYHTPVPHKTGPRPTVEDTPDGWLRDVTSDGDVEPNPGPSPSTPSAKRTRYNQDTPHMYQTPRMLRKRTADNTPPGQKRRRADHVPMANQEHQSSTLVYNHHKRKADGEPTHQPLPKRHQSTTHWDEQHPLGNQGNLRMKRPYEDTTDKGIGDSPRRKIRRTQRLRNRPYPRPTSWVHDPTPPDDPTYAYFHIQIYNNRLLTYTDHCATPNPPVHVAYNVWRRLPSTTGQLWEVHLRTDLPYYHIARHRLHVLTGTREGFHMALSIRYWLFLVQPLQHDLPLEHDTTGWAPPDHPSDVRRDGITPITPDVVYPQHTQWVPDATQDGDVEPNPGPDSNPPPHGLVRTVTENYERHTSGLHTGVQDQGDEKENPDILETNSNPQPEDTTEREPPQNGEPSTPPDQHTEGLNYVPPPPQEDTQAYTFHEDGNNPLDKLPIHTPTEYQLIEELVKLNTGASQQPMTTAEQDTLKASVVYDAQTRLKTYLTKHPNRAVTTEHIRRQTQEGVWYDRNTYQLPLFAQHKLRDVMTVRHEADSDGIHTVSEMAEAHQYTVHTEADHQGNPDIRNKTYLLLPQATGTRRNHERRMQRAAIQTEWGGSEDERVDQVLRALGDPGAKELILAYEADRQDITALQTYRMDCLHRAPLRKLARYVRGVYQFDKFPVRKWSPEHETMVDHLQPKPIMALHLDNTIKMGHEPTHKTYALMKGTPIQVGLEDRTDTLQPEPAKTTIVVECPPETGIRTRGAFMKRINGHQSDVASTVASKDPHNTFRWKCASEHTAGQSGSHAWRLHLPMPLLPRLTQALQTIKQEEENAGNPGPYWLTETDYESLYILRQQYTEHKEDRITSVQETLDDLDREQLELGRSIASFLKGFRPVDSYRLLVQFHPDADRRLIAQLLKGMKSYELVHVMTNVILNRNNWTQSTSRSRDIKRPPKPTRHDTTTVFVGWTQGAGDDTAKVVASFFGCWTSWKPEPNIWSDAGCTYASLQYQHATAVALSAGQYIGVAPGEYVHITLGDDNTDTQAAERIDQMLAHKMPQETGDDAAFRRRMKAGKQLGSDMMTERVIKEINREKQLFAEPEPINVADWDEAILNELGHATNDDTPSDAHPHMATMDTDESPAQQPDNPAKLTTAHTRQPHPAQKTKAHNKTPQKTPTKTTPPPKKKKAAPASPQPTQQADSTAAFTVDNRHKAKGKGPPKNPQGKGKK